MLKIISELLKTISKVLESFGDIENKTNRILEKWKIILQGKNVNLEVLIQILDVLERPKIMLETLKRTL